MVSVFTRNANAKEGVMQTLTAEQLKRVLEGPRRVPVIDVLDQDSYEQKHIPGLSPPREPVQL